MALSLGLYKTQPCYPLIFCGNKFFETYFKFNFYNRRWESNCTTLLEVDSIDDFTTQLVQKKSSYWGALQYQRKLLKDNAKLGKINVKRLEYQIDVNSLSTKDLDNVLKDAIDSCNSSLIKYVINKCFECNKIPSIGVLFQILSVYSVEGDKSNIKLVIELCKELQPSLLKLNSDFHHYLAEATWVKGNINEAVFMFENVYRNNAYLRRKIRCMLKYLILTVIPNRSEAILITLTNFTERIANEFKDVDPLMHLWQMCFLSEWYSDQCLSFDLLKRYSSLYASVSKKLTYFVALALKNERTDVVYRLLEMLLMLEHESNYTKVLEALFDYRVRRGDLRRCCEIMQWSLEHDIHLPIMQEQKFINMLLLYKLDIITKPIKTERGQRISGLAYKF